MGDTATRYGFISRFFHWFMALGFIWMIFTASSRFIDKDSALTKAVFFYHPQVGATILWLAALRIIWALSQSKNRPANNAMVKLGHGAMYVLMVLVPVIALIRYAGSGRGFAYLGMPIFEKTGIETQWMVDLGNNWHGLLGWVLFALIVGHILMAIKHKMAGPEQNVLPRMM